MSNFAQIPMSNVGPILINSPEYGDNNPINITVPMATYETPLWPSVNRGAKISQYSNGINIIVTKECMTRSIALQAKDALTARACINKIVDQKTIILLEAEVAKTSRFAKLINIYPEQIGNLIYLRLEYQTGDASGHNMTTLASEQIQNWILKNFAELSYVAVSGNFCIDKKVSAVNALLGRGKSVIAEMIIPKKICNRFLKSSPEMIVALNTKKNLLGSIAAGSLRSANAHFANMLLAFYLATGQDAANIVEGSQGITHTELTDQGDLYFSVNLPNLILGTVGNGKELDFVQENMNLLGLDQPSPKDQPGANSRKLAVICAATVLCGELSLLGAIANPGELISSHIEIERKK